MKTPIVVALCFVAACSTTTVLSSWKKPGTDLQALGNYIVIVRSKDEGIRRSAEDRFASEFRTRRATPSYRLFPGEAEDSAIRDAIKQGGFDGAIVVRLVSVDKEAEWVPGTWAGPMYGYYGWNVYDPGYMETNTYVRVETNIYKLPSEEMIWSMTSRTSNPNDLNQLIDETVKTFSAELQKSAPTSPPVSLSWPRSAASSSAAGATAR